jgi:tetratricopeptide (TPR) repeat protein
MDPFLSAMMHGEHPSKKPPTEGRAKTKLETEIESEIDAYVDGMELDEDPSHALLSARARRESIKRDIKEEVKMPELAQFIDVAMEILHSEGPHFLSQESNQALLSELSASNENLGDIGIKEASSEKLQALAKLSDESMKSIYEIAVLKFKEGLFPDSLALFSLLGTLDPGQPEYWFRLGIAAQKCEKLEMASRAYAATSKLDPENIGARLFAAECLINRGLRDEAKAEIAEAKKLMKNGNVDQIWLDFLPAVESMAKVKG